MTIEDIDRKLIAHHMSVNKYGGYDNWGIDDFHIVENGILKDSRGIRRSKIKSLIVYPNPDRNFFSWDITEKSYNKIKQDYRDDRLNKILIS